MYWISKKYKNITHVQVVFLLFYLAFLCFSFTKFMFIGSCNFTATKAKLMLNFTSFLFYLSFQGKHHALSKTYVASASLDTIIQKICDKNFRKSEKYLWGSQVTQTKHFSNYSYPIPLEFFVNTPENCASFLVDPWNFYKFLFFQYPMSSNPLSPIWIFSGIAYSHCSRDVLGGHLNQVQSDHSPLFLI